MPAKTTITLTSKVFRTAALRKAVDEALGKTARAHAEETQRLITSSVPTGRLYKRRRGFHRASARGQRPAVDSGNLVASVKAEPVPVTRQWAVYIAPNANRYNGVSAAKYAEILQSPYGSRKIMTPADAKKFEKVLRDNVLEAVGGLS